VAVVVVAATACAAGAPPAPIEAPLPVFAPPPPTAPRTDADRENDYTTAWSIWEAGRRDEAVGIFRRLVKELGGRPEAGVPSAPLAMAADGSRGVALAATGATWFDGGGEPLRFDVIDASTVTFLPGTTMAAFGGKNLTIVEAHGFGRVLRATNVTDFQVSENAGLVVYQETPEGSPARLHVWSTRSRSERSALPLRPGESVEVTSIAASPDGKEILARFFGQSASYGIAVFDETGRRIDLTGAADAELPSYSGDGKLIAYAHPEFTKSGAVSGRTLLVDRATRATIASTSAVAYPTATRFTKSGKLLLVGQLRKLSILEVPSLRVLATTVAMREFAGTDDDLQNVSSIDIVGNDAAFWAATGDSTNAVYRLPSGALVWKGRGERTVDATGAQRFLDREDKHQLVTIDAKLSVSQRALTQAELDAPYPTLDDPRAEQLRTALERTICTLHEKIFPAAACVGVR
jgi:hypothetical protein